VSNYSKKDGFTLIEILISLGILSATVALGTVVVNSTQVTRDAAYENSAFRIANSKLDELRFDGYDALPASGQFFDTELSSLPQGSASTSITSWNDKTKKVVTGVSWRSADGSMRFVSLTTLITQVGGL